MSAPQRDVPVDPDYDDLWELVALLSMAADTAAEQGHLCEVRIPERLLPALAAVDNSPAPDRS